MNPFLLTLAGTAGTWVTNEKRLLERTGLRTVDGIIGKLDADPEVPLRVIADAETLFAGA